MKLFTGSKHTGRKFSGTSPKHFTLDMKKMEYVSVTLFGDQMFLNVLTVFPINIRALPRVYTNGSFLLGNPQQREITCQGNPPTTYGHVDPTGFDYKRFRFEMAYF